MLSICGLCNSVSKSYFSSVLFQLCCTVHSLYCNKSGTERAQASPFTFCPDDLWPFWPKVTHTAWSLSCLPNLVALEPSLWTYSAVRCVCSVHWRATAKGNAPTFPSEVGGKVKPNISAGWHQEGHQACKISHQPLVRKVKLTQVYVENGLEKVCG